MSSVVMEKSKKCNNPKCDRKWAWRRYFNMLEANNDLMRQMKGLQDRIIELEGLLKVKEEEGAVESKEEEEVKEEVKEEEEVKDDEEDSDDDSDEDEPILEPTKIKCECGLIYSKKNKSTHIKTKRHLELIKQNK